MNSEVPRTMRAVVMSRTGIENLEVREIPVPVPNDDQVLVRVDAASVCPSMPKLLVQGSDHAFLGGWDIAKYPIVLGDEGAVTAVTVGRNLRNRFSPGERLCIQPAVDHDPINHRDRYRDPETMKKLAVGYTLGGHFGEYLLVTEEVLGANCLLKLPSPSMAAFEVSLSEPLSCVVSSQDHHIHMVPDAKTGERIPRKGLLAGGITVVFGAGVMGRFHTELAISYRPRVIVVFNRNQDRFDWMSKYLLSRAAEKRVAIKFAPLDLSDLPGTMKKIAGRAWADDVIDATRSQAVQKAALAIMGRGSVFNSFAGLDVGRSMVEVDLRKVHYDESIITGSSGGNWADTARTLKLIADGDFRIDPHIKLVGDLNHAVEFIKMVNKGEVDGKAIVYPHAKLDRPITVKGEWTKRDEESLPPRDRK